MTLPDTTMHGGVEDFMMKMIVETATYVGLPAVIGVIVAAVLKYFI